MKIDELILYTPFTVNKFNDYIMQVNKKKLYIEQNAQNTVTCDK